MLKKHFIPALIVVLISLGLLYLPQVLTMYEVPYLSSLIETKELSQDLVLHYSFDREADIRPPEETTQILMDRLEEKLTEASPNLHLSLDRYSLGELLKRHRLSINGDPKTVKGRKNEAMSFDGDDSLTVKGFTNPSGSFTLAAWIYSEDPNLGDSEINYEGRWIAKKVGASAGLLLKDVSGDEAKVGYTFQYEDGTSATYLPATVKTGKWHHLMASYDGKSRHLTIYLDGRLQGIKKLNGDPDLKPWQGLRVGGSDNYWFNGKVDDLRIYSQAIKIQQPPGVTVTDEGPHGQTGIIRGGPETVEGKFGTGLKFDGEADYLTAPGSDHLDLTDRITFSFWVKPKNRQTLNLLGKSGAYYFWFRDEQIHFTLFNNGEKFGQTPAEIPLGEWTHITGVYEKGKGVKVYKNGTLAGERGPYHKDIEVSNGSLRVGYLNDWADSYFAGTIDELRIYEVALSQQEIKALTEGKSTITTVKASAQVGGLLILLAVIFFVTYFTERLSGTDKQ